MKWAHHPNLRKRPRTPAKGRGSVQRAIKRAFAATSASALTSTQIYDWAHVRRRLGRRKSMPFGVYSRTLRTLRAICDPIERVPPHGAWLWRLRKAAHLPVPVLGTMRAVLFVTSVVASVSAYRSPKGLPLPA